MTFQIQDDIIRRALDFFGLRGFIQHAYEATVVPQVLVGNLGQRTTVAEAQNVPLGNAIFTVPKGETWRILYMSGVIGQTGGTVASRQYFTWIDANTGRAFHVPKFSRSDTTTETLTFSNALNQTEDWMARFYYEFLVGEGFVFRQVSVSGDGTRSATFTWLMYQRLGERLVDLTATT